MLHTPQKSFAPVPSKASDSGVSGEEAERRLRRSLRLPALPSAERRSAAPWVKYPSLFKLKHDSARDESMDFRRRAERRDPVARLTVYALNGVILLAFFPVGFALLIFNILGGENLRTTAHTMALTGMGTALATAGYAGQVVGF